MKAKLQAAADVVAALLVAAVLASVMLGVARRYLFGTPLVWIDELTTVLFIWSIFCAAALAVPLAEHVAFDLLYNALPPPARRWLGTVACAAAGVGLLAALPKTWGYIEFLWRERTPALQWRLDYVYLCFALFLAAAGLRFLWRAARLGLGHSVERE